MPRGDGTGPFGAGAGTGRGSGWCAGYGSPGYMSAGGGRGWRRRFFAAGRPGLMGVDAGAADPRPSDCQAEMGALERRAQALRAELDALSRRLGEIQVPEGEKK